MNEKDKKIWKYVVKKTKGYYGYTDFDKKEIAIDKKYHKSKGNHASDIKKNKDGTANILDTIVHEKMHSIHPKMHEKTVRKLTRKKVKKLSKKQKKKLYSKFNS